MRFVDTDSFLFTKNLDQLIKYSDCSNQLSCYKETPFLKNDCEILSYIVIVQREDSVWCFEPALVGKFDRNFPDSIAII